MLISSAARISIARTVPWSVALVAAAACTLGGAAPAQAVTVDPQRHHSMYSDMRDAKVACGGGGANGLGYMELTGYVQELGVSGANRLRLRFQKQHFDGGVWQTVATRQQTSSFFANDSRSFYFGPRRMTWSWSRSDIGHLTRIRVVALMDRYDPSMGSFPNIHYHLHDPAYWCRVR